MKKFLKNKFLVLIVCVILVSIVYLIVRKAINNYAFEDNEDIVSSDGLISEYEVNLELGHEESNKDSEKVSSEQGKVEVSAEGAETKGEFNSEAKEGVDTEVTNGKGKTESEIEEQDDKSFTDSGSISAEIEENERIYVYVTGEVNIPGVVILRKGSRIVDAINSAGGATSEADLSKVNLVYVLSDGMKVNIPNSGDLKNNSGFEYITMNSGEDSSDDYVTNRSDESMDNSENIDGSYDSTSGSVGSGDKSYSVVNINTATQTELESLPGIGPSLALKIINYRKENGKFSSIEDLKNVSGIGDVRFENLRKYIKV